MAHNLLFGLLVFLVQLIAIACIHLLVLSGEVRADGWLLLKFSNDLPFIQRLTNQSFFDNVLDEVKLDALCTFSLTDFECSEFFVTKLTNLLGLKDANLV